MHKVQCIINIFKNQNFKELRNFQVGTYKVISRYKYYTSKLIYTYIL